MSVELPFAPVDGIIRRNAGDLRVSADAAEELARRIKRTARSWRSTRPNGQPRTDERR